MHDSSDDDDGITFQGGALPPNVLHALVREEQEMLDLCVATRANRRADDEEAEDFFNYGGSGRRQGGLGTGRPAAAPRRPYKAATTEGGAAQHTRQYTNSYWWRRYLETPPQPCSLEWSEFRKKFRVPYPMFEELVERTRNSGLFPNELARKRGRPPAPLALKVAAALRYLALGVTADGLEEASELSPGAIEEFMFGVDIQRGRDQLQIGWFRWFVGTYYPEWVKGPTVGNDAEIQKLQHAFAMCGFPGAVASQDCVHVHWDNAPSQERWLSTGKEGFPTVAWNVNCSHAK